MTAFRRGDLERARAVAEAQLAAGAQSAELHHLLGLIDCRSGQFDSGVQSLRRACESDPDNVAYRVMLVRALADAGRPAEALDSARPPAGTSPAELALWHARAEAATALGAWPQAAEAWEKMCAAGIGGWRSWNNLGDALGAMGRWRESASALERAVGLNPGEIQLRRNFAGALNNAGRHEDSVEEFRRCIDAAPGDKSLRISLAPILADLGREAESREALNEAARLAGETEFRDDGKGLARIVTDQGGAIDANSLCELADLLERTSRMEALAQLIGDAGCLGVSAERIGYAAAASALREGNAKEAKRLLLGQTPSTTPTRWYRLLARIEESLGDADAAFAAAEAMNRSMADYDQWRAIGAQQLEYLRGIAAEMTPQWAAGLHPLEPVESARQAFVVGFPRSGTTLLDTFLRGHPDTEVLEEIPLVAEIERIVGPVSALPGCSKTQLKNARGAYLSERDRHVPPNLGGTVIDKLPLNMLAAPLFHCVFPTAPMLFSQRHPCDAVLSCFMQAFALTPAMACFLDIQDAARFYDSAMTIWTRSRDLLPLNVHTIVYEDLVEHPEATLRPAIEFLGLDWRPELLDHRQTARSRGRIDTPSYDQVTQPLTRAPIGRWKRYKKHLEPVLPLLLPWAERLGYSD